VRRQGGGLRKFLTTRRGGRRRHIARRDRRCATTLVVHAKAVRDTEILLAAPALERNNLSLFALLHRAGVHIARRQGRAAVLDMRGDDVGREFVHTHGQYAIAERARSRRGLLAAAAAKMSSFRAVFKTKVLKAKRAFEREKVENAATLCTTVFAERWKCECHCNV